ncbi:transposase family protein [Rothia nasimurium]|uniref:transposase family protein n=1 Tax=Rothia nasimurium TaxID=85336 RepID=UPI0009F606C2|nr:transposase family protein [Rothia nasimurium]
MSINHPNQSASLKHPGSLVIDGTLIPAWNWRSLGKTNFSGKHKKAGFNHQGMCTLDGKLLVITNPVPGARHDAYAFKHHGLDQLLDSSTLADKGYVGLGLATPARRNKARKTPTDVKVVNRFINSRRAVVGRVIAGVKRWRVLHSGFGGRWACIRGCFRWCGGWCFMLLVGLLNKPQGGLLKSTGRSRHVAQLLAWRLA